MLKHRDNFKDRIPPKGKGFVVCLCAKVYIVCDRAIAHFSNQPYEVEQ